MRNKRMDLRLKLYLIILVPLLAMGGLILWATIHSSENASLMTMQYNNQQLAVNIASQLGKESTLIRSLYTTSLEQSSEYKKLRDQLIQARLQSGARYVYMYNKTSDGWIYTVDGADWGDAEYSPYGTTFELDPQILERLVRGEVVTTGIVDVPIWGQLMSSFTPIKDSQGVVTGYLGIDVSAAEINRVSATTLNNTYRSVIPIFVVVLLLSLLMMLFVVRGILRQVNDIKLSLDQVSNGNLNIVSRHMTNDQLGDISNLINVMVNQLTNILKGIQQGSSMLQQSSKDIAGTALTNHRQSEELSRAIKEIAIGSMKQAEETEHSVQHSENLGNIMNEVGSYVIQFTGTSEQLSVLQVQVTRQHEALLEKSRENAKLVEHQQNISKSLTSRSELAASISGQIHNILKQTQILSLNASIEAARAGEAGKGFGVVANEMGHLAQQSERSIQEIDGILSSFVQEIYRMEAHLDTNMLAVKEQEEQIAECLQSFRQVSQLSIEVRELAQRLESRTIHMQSIRQEVEQHLSYIASATEETSAMSEEVSASAVEQQRSANELSDISGQLTLLADNLKSYADQFQIATHKSDAD
ncbi:methyl-accepting chemotaxis protein [Paenibacillus silvae]|uniref:methyl-accepting chemotaxis protein n=1 Tax=Paenibacillus silvae TaxID=1325358 RepID=UPI002005B2FA|nr:methyl-accepting chemotaxis protein [Paenibacillus silvae]MCK6073233.1 methyl-accepting chemotaxis protein [Paenibacillus silvae]MCK6149291.1 methyl-accepting chemotaxis protein [Paenibacillus silvae]MCK6267590.1 methyl-accepting chemotaxis protein [Paenibacillus silvae]